MLNYKEYIYAVYQERSFSKAAQKLFVSQPWLSSVVKKVEQEIKTPLFDRSTTPISLTPAGEYYIQQVEKVMAIEADMREHFAALADPGTRLHIGSSMFFCTYVLPRLFQEFRAQNPQITLTLTEGRASAMCQALAERKLDFFLEAEPLQDPKVQSVAWCTEEIAIPLTSSSSAMSPAAKSPPFPSRPSGRSPFCCSSRGTTSMTGAWSCAKTPASSPRSPST